MRSPVERLEEWCDKTERCVRFDGEMPEAAMTDRELADLARISAYRAVLAEYRDAEGAYLSYHLGEYEESAKDMAFKIVSLLADAVNPEETPDE